MHACALAKYKRLENNPLYGILVIHACIYIYRSMHACDKPHPLYSAYIRTYCIIIAS